MDHAAPAPAPATAAPAASAREVRLSPAAARRVAEIVAQEGNPALMLRLTVSGGGCSGFQYGFSLDTAVHKDDRVFDAGIARLVVDETSLELLGGAEVDYEDGLMASHFTVRNPNATSSCGCGSSFSVG
ncbi:iron-sulfur cluster insertion protein ErpA [Elioraea tepida]|jgi:iron-sulfur cluster insertion protein|uniref:Iron-sulfur cluster insertion protein ErpA n=1 Tax=Elioraea tepida TaxID=2843330 RepID=A0A975U390_9PROT|nr:iron-sulfur cluster insertion protein ErpA [Elioraea tepida]QXM24943.1 iron-sulfur cluster insertion protein ErpA [Elioraea tepida]